MSNQQGQSSLVSKLTLLVLVLILGCLVALLFKSSDAGRMPMEQTMTAEVTVPLSEPATPPAAVTVVSAESRSNAPNPAPATVVTLNQGRASSPSSPVPTLPPQPVPAAAPGSGVHASASAGAGGTAAPKTLRFDALPTGNQMRIDGKATGKTWHSISKIITGSFEVSPAWLEEPASAASSSPRCEIQIPVRTLKSQAAAGAGTMDKRMQIEMKAADYPAIHYRLEELVPSTNAPSNAGVNADAGKLVFLSARGALAIAGVTNPVVFTVAMERVGGDVVRFTGTYETKMTAFGITPPEFKLLGIGLTCADEVALSWTWMVGVNRDAVAK